ncbi:exodeoxyribonuclease VII large subunit, partial [Campylobacter jejuni]|nr:exodeoxyribonuclease VII large subunit [Campylobacter jejuni]EAH9858239.1 exodeoxyribonuclease VII large subunit [Campylobacter jejuni]EAI0810983.1 exodeoxyribonuclease VII large subunit [Campylobacter jejuni]EAL4617986.1 exodeoxyribonuclease VII large subunit [Campylobacter jejuni]ECO2824833.1 exodeoxyribonuclease VII large subunit [Campylobacter jejuni]
IDEKIKQSHNIEKQLNHLLANQMRYNELKLDKLQNAYLQHENFFNKSKKFICIRKNGKIANLEDLKSDDIVILSSQTSQKEAKIL